MKKKYVAIGALSLLVIILFGAPLYGEDTISFSYDSNLPPFAWEEEGQMKGIFIDLVAAVIQDGLGIPVIHKKYPWKRTVEKVKSGKVDGCLLPCTLKEDWVRSSTEVAIVADQKVFASAKSPRLEELRTLKNTGSFSYDSELYKWEALRPFEWVSGRGEKPFEKMKENGFDVYFIGWDSLLKFLAEGRADAMIMSRHMGLYQIQKLGFREKIIETPATINQEYCFSISARSPYVKILPELDKILRQIKTEGVIQAIENRYIQ